MNTEVLPTLPHHKTPFGKIYPQALIVFPLN